VTEQAASDIGLVIDALDSAVAENPRSAAAQSGLCLISLAYCTALILSEYCSTTLSFFSSIGYILRLEILEVIYRATFSIHNNYFAAGRWLDRGTAAAFSCNSLCDIEIKGQYSITYIWSTGHSKFEVVCKTVYTFFYGSDQLAILPALPTHDGHGTPGGLS
jgi:hypothetical protein